MNEALAHDRVSEPYQQALACYERGDILAAAALLADLLEQPVPRHDVLQLAGDVAVWQRRHVDALSYYQNAMALAADNDALALSWSGIGRTARGMGKFLEAEDAFRRAILCAPQEMQYTMDLAQVLSDQGRFEVALELLRALARNHPADPVPPMAIGTLLLQWQRAADAQAFYEIAITLDPEYATAYTFAGAVHTMLGNFEKAEDHYRHTLALQPNAPAYYQLAQIKKFSAEDPDIVAMEARLKKDDADLGVDAKADAAFGLAKAYDDIGNYERAFECLRLGNELKRQTVAYDVQTDIRMMDAVAALFTKDFIARYKDKTTSDLAPIFILGMPRSGTTLLEQMLAAHSKVKAGGELSYMGRVSKEIGNTWESRGDRAPGTDDEIQADFVRSGARYAELTENLRHRHPRFTDKLPENFLYIGLIALLFPKSTIIHCLRDPVATCFSCYQRRFSIGNQFTYDQGELAQYYGGYRRLMAHWHSVYPGRILDVRYEDMVTDPETGIRKVLAFSDLEFERECLGFQSVRRAVSTASNVQVRQPIYQSGIDHWRHYENHLGRLVAGLKAAGVTLPNGASVQENA